MGAIPIPSLIVTRLAFLFGAFAKAIIQVIVSSFFTRKKETILMGVILLVVLFGSAEGLN